MKTSHIVIVCVTVFLLVALWLSYKAMVLTAEKKKEEKEKELKSSPYLNSTPDPFDGLSKLHVGCGYDPNRTL